MVDSRNWHHISGCNCADLDEPADKAPSQALDACLETSCLTAHQEKLLGRSCLSPFAIVVIKSQHPRSSVNIRAICDLLEDLDIYGVVAPRGSYAVLFMADDDARLLADALPFITSLSDCVSAISLPFDSVDDIPRQYGLVMYTLSRNQGKKVSDAKAEALSYLSREMRDSMCVTSLLHPALAKIAEYDRSNRSDLLNTLRVYLENDCNAQHSANLLYLHRNSLQYRVRRIQEIGEIRLEDAAERAYLRLSFFLSDEMLS